MHDAREAKERQQLMMNKQKRDRMNSERGETL